MPIMTEMQQAVKALVDAWREPGGPGWDEVWAVAVRGPPMFGAGAPFGARDLPMYARFDRAVDAAQIAIEASAVAEIRANVRGEKLSISVREVARLAPAVRVAIAWLDVGRTAAEDAHTLYRVVRFNRPVPARPVLVVDDEGGFGVVVDDSPVAAGPPSDLGPEGRSVLGPAGPPAPVSVRVPAQGTPRRHRTITPESAPFVDGPVPIPAAPTTIED